MPDPSGKRTEEFSPEKHKKFASMVASNLLKDYGLTLDELDLASEVLWPDCGGAEYAKILHYATKGALRSNHDHLPRRIGEGGIHNAMYYHLSNADWERMSLRVGASLMVNGQTELGKRIVEMTAEGNWKPPPVEKSYWLNIFQLTMYAIMFSVMLFSFFLSGAWLLVAIGAPVVLVAGGATFYAERPKWKVGQEQREAWHYEAALDQIAKGAAPKDVFRSDGTLVGHPSSKEPVYAFEVSADPRSA